MSPLHAAAVAIISTSLAASITLVENYRYRGTVIRWLWSLTGFNPMPDEVATAIAVLLVTIIFSIIGFLIFARKK